MTRTLTLVKHARPEKLDGIDSHAWPLSEQGRRDAGRLAEVLAGSGADYRAVLSSPEPKAAQTAGLIASALRLPVHTHDGLREHDRSNVPLMKTAEFVSSVELFFRRSNQLVLGRETARQALRRFESAVDEVLLAHPQGDLVIVSHGTVLALWLAQYCQLHAYQVWRDMGLPSWVSLMWPDCEIIARQDRM